MIAIVAVAGAAMLTITSLVMLFRVRWSLVRLLLASGILCGMLSLMIFLYYATTYRGDRLWPFYLYYGFFAASVGLMVAYIVAKIRIANRARAEFVPDSSDR